MKRKNKKNSDESQKKKANNNKKALKCLICNCINLQILIFTVNSNAASKEIIHWVNRKLDLNFLFILTK